jgi:hypothetical protein
MRAALIQRNLRILSQASCTSVVRPLYVQVARALPRTWFRRNPDSLWSPPKLGRQCYEPNDQGESQCQCGSEGSRPISQRWPRPTQGAETCVYDLPCLHDLQSPSGPLVGASEDQNQRAGVRPRGGKPISRLPVELGTPFTRRTPTTNSRFSKIRRHGLSSHSAI